MKFGIVGVSNTLLAFAVYTVLLKVFGVWYLAASGIGFVVGAVNGFLLNRRWTFKSTSATRSTPVRWAVVQTCGLACNSAWCTCSCTTRGMDKLVADLATAIVTVTDVLRQPRLDLQDAPADLDGIDLGETVARRSRSTVDIAGQPGAGEFEPSEVRQAAKAPRGSARRGRSEPPRARAAVRAAS